MDLNTMDQTAKSAAPTVTVEQGKLKGKFCVDLNGKYFLSFQGIPYAKAPVGELRFKPPVPAESWTGIRDATEEGKESVSRHMLYFHSIGSEDCLNLNVYTPELPSKVNNAFKAVMVWIHGGGFTSGSSKTEIYGPEFLIKEDIVLVSINYRLGILGFLSLEDTSLGVPGNNGLKDMVLALKWVQKNISQFGGDPNNVTIFGESCGAAACNYLVLSPTTQGLFHRAIFQSGSLLCPWPYGRRNAIEIAKVLGHESKDEKDAFAFLKEIPAEKFIEAQDLIKDYLRTDLIRPFCPVIEKPNPDAFITENPLNIIISGNYNHVPILTGYTNKEGIFVDMFNGTLEPRISDFELSIPRNYNLPKGTKESLTLAKNIKEFYYRNYKGPEDDAEIYYRVLGDVFFIRGIHMGVRTFLKTLNKPIYFYRFSVDATLNLFKVHFKKTAKGACHADDLGYLFKSTITPEKMDPNSIETKTIHRMTKFWTNFAKTGNPNPTEKDPLIDVKWPAVTKKLECLDIGEKLSVISGVDLEELKFWDKMSNIFNSTF